MYLGKVTGTVVSTSKQEGLVGCKLLVVERLTPELKGTDETAIAVDTVGAGVGVIVIVATGSSARQVAAKERAPVDAAIVGIVDEVELG
ncbi:MAG: EutN/CcmL family microcompartment protein [Clostridiales Family XIII bacterium]|jgi:ethanolamine utilization protein EutN|nr:EutN/CcmL family microcompartment protein [Clostridiales Family XIII bacterium]